MGSNYYQQRNKYSDEYLIDLYVKYGTLKEATKHIDVSSETIRRALKRNGIKPDGYKNNGHHENHKNGTPRKITDEQLIECCKTMTRKEIAAQFGMHIARVDARMHNLGVHAVKENRYVSDWHWTAGTASIVEKVYGDRFEFVGIKGKQIRLRCNDCGCLIDRSRAAVIKGRVVCDGCKKKVDEAIRILSAGTEILKGYRIKERHVCEACGMVYYSSSKESKYCSESCRKRAKGRNHSYRKRARKYGGLYDPSVTREKIIERDGMVCQICGKKCDPEDKRWGSFGPDYPTLDHIIPLAKGGTHTWDNCQCACAMCNSEKRDLITA